MRSLITIAGLLLLAQFSSCIDFSPQKPVEIVTQRKTTETVDDYPSFIFLMTSDHSIWYNSKTSKDDTVMQKVKETIKENLKQLIAAYKDECLKNNIKDAYWLQGDNLAKYDEFKTVLTAFKENEIYKFKMITIDE